MQLAWGGDSLAPRPWWPTRSPDDPGTRATNFVCADKALLIAERLRAERLEQIIKELQRHRFGRRAETLPEESDAPAAKAERITRRRANRGSLPAHLPRIETVVDVDDKSCPCCRHALHVIGEDVAERLDIVPAQFRVLVTRRPRYGCRACEGVVVQAPARLIEGGIPAELSGISCGAAG